MNSDLSVWFKGGDSIAIAADVLGPEDGMPVILSHGGGQTRHAWGRALRSLGAAGFRVYALDLRGHGESGWSPIGDYSMDAYVTDLRAVVASLPEPPVLVGASLGGIASLLAAGEPPFVLMRGVVLVDVSPHLRTEGVAAIWGFMQNTLSGFDTFEAAADTIARYLPHRPRPSNSSGLERNLRRGNDGRLYWHWDPRTIDKSFERAEMNRRLEAAAAAVNAPVLLLRGEYSELVTNEVARQFMARFENGSVTEVADARHMVAGDENDLFVKALLDFARTVRAAAGQQGSAGHG